MATHYKTVKAYYNKHKNQWCWFYRGKAIYLGTDENGIKKYKTPQRKIPIKLGGSSYHRTYDPTLKVDINLTKEQQQHNKKLDTIIRRKEAIKQEELLIKGVADIEVNPKAALSVADWLFEYADRYSKKATRSTYTVLANKVRKFGNPKWFEFDARYINGLVAEQNKRVLAGKIKQTTLRDMYETIRFVLVVAKKEGLIDGFEDIFDDMHKVDKGETAVGSYFSRDELTILDRAVCRSAMVKEAFLFCCWTSLRINEALELKWGDIREVDGKKQMTITERKNKNSQIMTLSTQAVKYLPPSAGPEDLVFYGLSYASIRNNLTAWVNEAGIKRDVVKTHDGRRTAAYIIKAAGHPDRVVMKWLDHSDIKSTEKYLNKAFGDMFDNLDSDDLLPALN
jgi:integrase